MRLTYTVTPLLTEDTAGQSVLFGPLGNDASVIVDSLQNMESGRIVLKPKATQQLSTGTLSQPMGFYLRMDHDCQVQIDDGAQMQLTRASVSASAQARMFFEGQFTTLHITAPDDAPATGVYVVWGDPLAGDPRFASIDAT
jgi:hypothetical protein